MSMEPPAGLLMVVLHSLPTLLDLLALTSCIGILACLLWILPRSVEPSAEPLQRGLRQLLLIALVTLTISSLIELVTRAAEMSGQPMPSVLPILPAILGKTHYGHAWLLRLGGLVLLWAGWSVITSALSTRIRYGLMLVGGLVIAFTCAASGHGADSGDLSLTELIYWLHLLAGSVWAGGLISFAVVILPQALRQPLPPDLLASMASRFSLMAGAALAMLVLTGIYNTWLQVGSFSLLYNTAYGRILSVKVLLVLVMMWLGASNRYVSVPLLQSLAGESMKSSDWLVRWFAGERPATRHHATGSWPVIHRFRRKVSSEALLMTAVLACAALLIHSIPARHAQHEMTMHHAGAEN